MDAGFCLRELARAARRVGPASLGKCQRDSGPSAYAAAEWPPGRWDVARSPAPGEAACARVDRRPGGRVQTGRLCADGNLDAVQLCGDGRAAAATPEEIAECGFESRVTR